MIQSFAAVSVPAGERRPLMCSGRSIASIATRSTTLAAWECVSATSEGPPPYASVRVLDSKKAIGTFKEFQCSLSIIRMDYFSDGVCVRSGVRDENWKGQQNNFQEDFYLYDTARFFALLMR
jgi:hypothetical protein